MPVAPAVVPDFASRYASAVAETLYCNYEMLWGWTGLTNTVYKPPRRMVDTASKVLLMDWSSYATNPTGIGDRRFQLSHPTPGARR